MRLDGALSIATSGLGNIGSQLALISNNVANASTPDYTTEVSRQESLVGDGQPMGVRTDGSTRQIDLALQQSAYQQDTLVAGLTTTTNSLSAIDAVLGTPGQGSDIASLLGKVQESFSSLLGDPSNTALQTAVVQSASQLTTGINALSGAYTTQRQAAQDAIVAGAAAANQQLQQIGGLSSRIVAARSAGQSTADLENQRDAAVHELGHYLNIKTLVQPNGDMSVFTASGSQLPTRAATGPLVTSSASIGPDAWYPGGGIPSVTLNGTDITSQIQGGQIGANIALRDQTLPQYQAELDEFSAALANRFDAQGLTLFTNQNGTVPAGGGNPVQAGYVGFAASVTVNPAVSANPALVRDGTHDVAGSASGATAFTVNPPGGPAGSATLINRILTNALGAEVQTGVPQPSLATQGLGPSGTLTAPNAATGDLGSLATALVTTQASSSAAASSRLSTEQAVQTTLTSKLSATSGVNIDNEMSQMIALQNAYQANARVITIVQTLFTQFLQSVQ